MLGIHLCIGNGNSAGELLWGVIVEIGGFNRPEATTLCF